MKGRLADLLGGLARSGGHPEQERKQALVRLGVWAFATAYVGVAIHLDFYPVALPVYLAVAGGVLALSLGHLLSLWRWPRLRGRVGLSLFLDVVASTLVVLISGGASSPFFLFYVWISIGYGVRYGRAMLYAASGLVLVGYGSVLALEGAFDYWVFHGLVGMLGLAVLPLYLDTLLKVLQRTSQDADAANRAKSLFLANITHEIRTPLSGLSGMVSLLQATPLNREQRDYVESLKDSSEALRALIDDILDVSKIEAGKLAVEEREFNPHDVLREVASILTPMAAAKGLEFVSHVQSELPQRVLGDAQRLRQVLLNLAGNAVKFTERGEVVIRAQILRRLAGGCATVRVEVSDTGIGIAPDKLPTIFESFNQGDTSTMRRYGGTGLGTTISRELVKLMGGEIGATSELGKGSSFWFELPWKCVATPEAGIRAGRLRDRRVLILEDNVASRTVMVDYCTSLGMEPQCIRREEEIVPELLRAQGQGRPYDVVLLGDTPRGEGHLELADALRAEVDSPPPLCHLSFLGYRNLPHLTERPSVNAYLRKPVSREVLRDCLLALFDRAGASNRVITQEILRPPPPEAGRVLVADDSEINAKVVKAFLYKAGYQVDVAEDGLLALQMLQARPYRLALVDIRMPRMDGLELSRAWRRGEPLEEHLPIIALTATATPEDRHQCMVAGMDDFLTKPVDPSRLLELVERYLARAVAV